MNLRILTSAVALVGAGMIGGIAGPMLAGAAGSNAVSDFDAITPQRQHDSRQPAKFPGAHKLVAGEAIEVFVGPYEAVALNVTVTEAEGPGFVTVFPGNKPLPSTSTVNFVGPDAVANSGIFQVGPSGTVKVYTMTAAHVVVDMTGVFSIFQLPTPVITTPPPTTPPPTTPPSTDPTTEPTEPPAGPIGFTWDQATFMVTNHDITPDIEVSAIHGPFQSPLIVPRAHLAPGQSLVIPTAPCGSGVSVFVDGISVGPMFTFC